MKGIMCPVFNVYMEAEAWIWPYYLQKSNFDVCKVRVHKPVGSAR